MPSETRLKLDLRIHRQRLALRENWQIVDARLWTRIVRPNNRYLQNALRLVRENRDLKERLEQALSDNAALRGRAEGMPPAGMPCEDAIRGENRG